MRLECEDCEKEIEPGDYRPLDLFRHVPGVPGGYVFDSTKQKWVARSKNARHGGRRFRRFDLCRKCAGEALRHRSRNGTVMEGGKKRALRTSERVPPKRGGRPRLLSDGELRNLHELYLRSGVSMLELARRLADTRSKGTKSGYTQALLYGWRRLKLPLRAKAKQIALSRHGTDGTRSRHWKQRCKAKTSRGKKRCTQYVRRELTEHGSRPAVDGLCWNHANHGVREAA